MLYRQQPEDFRVEEVLLFPPCGEGAHVYVLVEKTDLDSAEVARRLAVAAGCAESDVGFAGRKDRRAVATQWFSVPAGNRDEELELGSGVRILERSRHGHRLRTGQLLGNRFRAVVREVEEDVRQEVADRAIAIRADGFPNRFGVQRFGRHGGNAARGLAILGGEEGPRNRRTARLLVSALQSEVFNTTLGLRLRDVPLGAIVEGDVAMVHATGGVFWVADAAAGQIRADAHELSATGPMHGDKMRRPHGEASRWEDRALEEHGLERNVFTGRRGLRLHGARRSVRALAPDLSVEFGSSEATVTVTLAPGCYVSVLLEELFGPGLEEVGRDETGDGGGR